jgi:arylsulfatase
MLLACAQLPASSRPASSLPEVRKAAKDWNCVLIILDAATAHHFSCYGFPDPTSPTLDRLAREGVRFKQGYSTFPNTGVGVFSLVYSLWPWAGRDGHQMPQGDYVAAEIEEKHYPGRAMSAGGFRSAAFIANKFALFAAKGFDEDHPMCVPAPGFGGTFERAMDISRKVGDWVDQHKKERFFAWVHYVEPHGPWGPPPGEGWRYRLDAETDKELHASEQAFHRIWHEREAKAPFFDSFANDDMQKALRLYRLGIRYVDEAIAQLLERLAEAGVRDKTFLLLVADHGEGFGEHGFFQHAASVYEEEVKIPFLAWFPPGVQLPAHQVEAAVSLVDVLPTLADLFSLKDRSPQWEGASLLPFIFGSKKGEDRAVFSRSWRAAMSDFRAAVYAIRTSRYFLRWDTIKDTRELYDVLNDPLEKHDLSAAQPELTDKLWKRLKKAAGL